MADTYLKRFAKRVDETLRHGETLRLVQAGNHAQGCVFQDGIRLATPELLAAMDRISRQVLGFFIGRYDIRYASEEALRQGRDFSILELNGATAEATSIYDARNSLFNAYRTLYLQWELVFRIAAINRANGHRPASFGAIWREWRKTAALVAEYPSAD